MLHLGRFIVIVALALAPIELLAQNSACANGRMAPYFGWDVTECNNCVIRGSYFEYLQEPVISSIRSDGPAAGRLREHDLLVAVDGFAITTPEAWHRLRDVKPGEEVRFTASNGGVTRDETIRVSCRCVAGPSPAPAPRIIVLR